MNQRTLLLGMLSTLAIGPIALAVNGTSPNSKAPSQNVEQVSCHGTRRSVLESEGYSNNLYEEIHKTSHQQMASLGDGKMNIQSDGSYEDNTYALADQSHGKTFLYKIAYTFKIHQEKQVTKMADGTIKEISHINMIRTAAPGTTITNDNGESVATDTSAQDLESVYKIEGHKTVYISEKVNGQDIVLPDYLETNQVKNGVKITRTVLQKPIVERSGPAVFTTEHDEMTCETRVSLMTMP